MQMIAQDVPWDDINTFLAIIGGALLLGLAGGVYHIWKNKK
jgi:LPXTG-motif cell wall-anchored protein